MEKELILDPQYLENTYELYYFVPLPDCERFDELDEENEHTVCVSNGTFVEKEWADNGCKE